MQPIRVYLAGPDVFLAEPLQRAGELQAICARHGLLGIFPLDAVLELEGLEKSEQGYAIARANEGLIRSCAGVLANMTPFRGPSTDVGTAFELGFARALGKVIVGYTEVDAVYHERVVAWAAPGPLHRRPDGTVEDASGMAIEDFGLTDNLMLDGALRESGGTVVRPADVAGSGESVVERAARLLAERLRSGSGAADG